MPTASIGPYQFESRDKVEYFHGNQLTYIHWEEHNMYCAALAYPFPPTMPFRAIIENVLPEAYGYHPEWSKVKWDEVTWMLDGRPFIPNLDASLADNGLGHKSLIRFWTPGLHGVAGSAT